MESEQFVQALQHGDPDLDNLDLSEEEKDAIRSDDDSDIQELIGTIKSDVLVAVVVTIARA
ncbi:hypothetical protein RYH80_06095 [Halobaculum sp. MBLA0147]|uniref:hypothetical protein n=1 Tax=Halobaculum sp. MBLA0147 TaxID=3079934 RepID=UPI003524D0EA